VIASHNIPVFGLAFTVAYAAIYVVCTEVNLPLVSYHPVTAEIGWLWQPQRSGPVMYWYGWMLTSLIGALVVAFVAAAVPEPWLQRAIMFGGVAAVAYLLLYTAALFIYDNATVELEFLKSRSLSVAGALAVAVLVSCFVPSHWNKRVWAGWSWLVPAGSIAVLAYYLMPYFTR